MPFLNFGNHLFSMLEEAATDNALQAFKATVLDKMATLTAEVRQWHVNNVEHNKMLLNKIKEYCESGMPLNSSIDFTTYLSEYQSRNFLELIIKQLTELIRGLENAKMLHDSFIIGGLKES